MAEAEGVDAENKMCLRDAVKFAAKEIGRFRDYACQMGWDSKRCKTCFLYRLCLAGEVCRARLERRARICDKMDRHKAIYDCRTWLTRHGYRLSSKQDEVMMQTIWWLYDETKEAEVKYERQEGKRTGAD